MSKELSEADIAMLRKEGNLVPVYTGKIEGDEELVMSPNSTYLVVVNK